jgi:hypothetical protein
VAAEAGRVQQLQRLLLGATLLCSLACFLTVHFQVALSVIALCCCLLPAGLGWDLPCCRADLLLPLLPAYLPARDTGMGSLSMHWKTLWWPVTLKGQWMG